MVRECVRRPENVAGAFTFGVDRTSFKTKCPTGVGTMEMFANFRARNFLLPYGDQVGGTAWCRGVGAWARGRGAPCSRWLLCMAVSSLRVSMVPR